MVETKTKSMHAWSVGEGLTAWGDNGQDVVLAVAMIAMVAYLGNSPTLMHLVLPVMMTVCFADEKRRPGGLIHKTVTGHHVQGSGVKKKKVRRSTLH